MKDKMIETIGNRIKETRKEKKITRDELEEKCCLNDQSIKRIEMHSSKTFDVVALCAVADYFDVDVEYLLGIQDAKRRVNADASMITGLSYEAVEKLNSMKNKHGSALAVLSRVICHPQFEMLLRRIEELTNTISNAAVIFGQNVVHRLLSGLNGGIDITPNYQNEKEVIDTKEYQVTKQLSLIIHDLEAKAK